MSAAPQEPDNANLLSVITDIRMKSGLGAKPTLSELADAIADLRGQVERLERENETYRTAFDGIEPAAQEGREAVADSLWVPAKPEHKKIGWTYDFDQTERLSRAAEKATGYEGTMEVIEFVMAEADRRHKSALSQPHPSDEGEPSDAEVERASAAIWNKFLFFIDSMTSGAVTRPPDLTDADNIARAALLAAKSKGGQADG